MVFGRFVVEAYQRERTVYGLTDQSVIIISGLLTTEVRHLNPRTMSDISAAGE